MKKFLMGAIVGVVVSSAVLKWSRAWQEPAPARVSPIPAQQNPQTPPPSPVVAPKAPTEGHLAKAPRSQNADLQDKASKSATTLQEKIETLLKERKPQAAARLLESAIAKDPTNSQLYLRLALLQKDQLMAPQKAIETLQEGARKGEVNQAILDWLGNLHTRMGTPEKAMQFFNSLPDSTQTSVAKGMLLLENQRYEEAVQTLEMARKQGQDVAPTLAYALAQSGNTAAAQRTSSAHFERMTEDLQRTSPTNRTAMDRYDYFLAGQDLIHFALANDDPLKATEVLDTLKEVQADHPILKELEYRLRNHLGE